MIGEEHKSIFSGTVKIGELEIEGSQLKWSIFKDFPADRSFTIMGQYVFPFIKNLDWNKDSAYPNIKEHKKLETFKDPGEKVKEYDKIWQDIIAN